MSETENILVTLELPCFNPEIKFTGEVLPEITEEPDVDEDIEEEEVQEYKPRDYKEKTHEDRLCYTLDEMGVQYERQKRVETGIIDIFIYGQPPTIIEVKKSINPYLLMQAIVQLKFYAKCFKKSKIYISTPDPICERDKAVLKEFGVGEARWVFKPNPGDPVNVTFDPLYHKLAVDYLD